MFFASTVVLFGVACRQALGISEEFVETTDAGPDVADAAQPEAAMTLRFCDVVSPKVTFCADFDGEDPRAGFYGTSTDYGMFGGATLAFTEQNVRSSPRIATFGLPVLLSDKTFASGALVTTLNPQAPRDLTLQMDFRIEKENFPEGKGRANLLTLNFGKDVGAITVFRNYEGLNLEVFTGMESVVRKPFTSKTGVGSWHTLSLLVHNYPVTTKWDAGTFGDASVPEGSGEVFAIIGGVDAKLPLPPRMQNSKEPVNFDFGAHTARGPMDAFVVHLDNITFNAPDILEVQ